MTPGDAKVPRESLAAAFAPKKTTTPPTPQQQRSLAGMVAPVTHLPAPVPASEPAPTQEAPAETAAAQEAFLATPVDHEPQVKRSQLVDKDPGTTTAGTTRLRKAGVWVPASMIAKLQSRRSGTRDTITDIVLAAIRIHRAAIVAEAGVATSADDDPFEDQTPRRRRDLDEPTTQITLLLTPKNFQTLDEMAADADMSRSAFVTEALRRTL